MAYIFSLPIAFSQYPRLREFIPRRESILPSALLILFFIASARVTLELLPPTEIAPALIWPPIGISLAFMFLYGYRMAAAVALASIIHLIARDSALSGIIIGTITNTFFPIAGTYVMRLFNYDPALPHLRDAYTLLIVGSLVTIVFPGLLLLMQWLLGAMPRSMPGEELTARFFRIWGGAVFSAVIITPLILSWLNNWRINLGRTQLLEMLLGIGCVAAASIVVFLTTYAHILSGLVFLVILLPFLWLALRFEPKYSALGLFLMSTISIVGVALNAANSPDPIGQRLYTVELFMVFLAFIFLILASLVEERRRAAVGLRQHVEQLESALQQIRVQDKAKTEFLAVLSHELRNPLAPIYTALELLKLKGVTKTETETFNMIDNRLATMRRLLDDLLDISRISHNKMRLQKEPTNLAEIIDKAILSLKDKLDRHRQTVNFAEISALFILDADPTRLEQVFRNLLSNASKYSKDGARIQISAELRGDAAEICVSDEGIGIDRSMLKKIFEPFLQIEDGHRGREGLGIGLSLTQKIVEIHGGSIRAESDGIHKGSKFFVTIPLHTAHNERQKITLPLEFAPISHTSILIVDDNKSAADSLGSLLELTGHRVAHAYSGTEAIQKVRSWKPNVVILDIGLPDMSGYEVAKKIRTRDFSGMIIALTGYGQESDKQRALQEGFDHHLVKPVGISEIQAVLR